MVESCVDSEYIQSSGDVSSLNRSFFSTLAKYPTPTPCEKSTEPALPQR